jgi:DNA-binding GntR family transcriptional regulator
MERTDPPYLQLVKHYRDAITTGRLAAGERLPPSRELADTLGVAYTTVAKALRQLQAEGFVRTSNQGVFVSWHETSTYNPRDRIRASRTTRHIYPPSEKSRIISAGIVTPPTHVSEAMHLNSDQPQAIRRERVNYHGETPVTHSVSWLPADLATAVPELVGTERIPGGTIGRIAEVTGRQVLRDCYRECARRATPDEAHHLNVQPGDPVLAGQNWWYEDAQEDRVLEFGEFLIPEHRWVTVSSNDA